MRVTQIGLNMALQNEQDSERQLRLQDGLPDELLKLSK